MKIKWGALAVDGRGKLGGHVAADGAGGSYLRTKVTPNNPQTMAQAKARSQFGIISQKWNGLTEAQRAAWNNAVDAWKTTDIFGDLKQPSGKELFIRLNLNIIGTTYSFLSIPPKRQSMPVYVLASMVMVLSTENLFRFPATSIPGVYLTLEATGPVTTGTTNANAKFRKVYSYVGSSQARPESYTAYVSVFGVPQLGQKIFARYAIIKSSGQKIYSNTMQINITN